MVEFQDVLYLLKVVRERTQGIVGACWDGAQIKVTVARPETGKQIFVMFFDDDRDFQRPSSELIEEFAAACEAYFAGSAVNG